MLQCASVKWSWFTTHDVMTTRKGGSWENGKMHKMQLTIADFRKNTNVVDLNNACIILLLLQFPKVHYLDTRPNSRNIMLLSRNRKSKQVTKDNRLSQLLFASSSSLLTADPSIRNLASAYAASRSSNVRTGLVGIWTLHHSHKLHTAFTYHVWWEKKNTVKDY